MQCVSHHDLIGLWKIYSCKYTEINRGNVSSEEFFYMYIMRTQNAFTLLDILNRQIGMLLNIGTFPRYLHKLLATRCFYIFKYLFSCVCNVTNFLYQIRVSVMHFTKIAFSSCLLRFFFVLQLPLMNLCKSWGLNRFYV